MTSWHEGPVEEYQVRDCTTGDDEVFQSFKAADTKFTQWCLDRKDHPIMLIAVIASS